MQPEPSMSSASAPVLDRATVEFYQQAMRLMEDAKVPFLVGGAYAFAVYTGIERHTKDFDVFIRRGDFERTCKLFENAGYRAELTFAHWIGKVWYGEDFVDLIFSAGNGVAMVDDLWFKHAAGGRVFDMDVKLIPAEEMIWSKGLIMERERFDGADVVHLIQAIGNRLDWRRLLDRYGRHWRALFAHVVLFGFIFPSDRSRVPSWVIAELSERLAKETARGDLPDKICYGTIVSRQQYLVDVNERGYRDARLEPLGNMSEEQIAEWTKGIEIDGTK